MADPKGFDAVTVETSDMKGIIVPDEQPVAAKEPETPATSENPETETPEEPKKYKFGEIEYEEQKILDALKDSENKSNWEKSNTEKAQSLAKEREAFKQEQENTKKLRNAIEPMIEFIKTLKDDEDLADIREQFIGRYGNAMGKIFDDLTAFDPDKAPNPYLSDLERVTKEFEDFKSEQTAQVEAQKFLDEERKEFRTAHGLDEKQAIEVQEFATSRFTETGEVLTLEAAFRVMDYDKKIKEIADLKEKAEKKKLPTPPIIPTGAQGAKNIETKKPTSFDEIKIPDGMRLVI